MVNNYKRIEKKQLLYTMTHFQDMLSNVKLSRYSTSSELIQIKHSKNACLVQKSNLETIRSITIVESCADFM